MTSGMFTGKVALVTGGGNGMGRATARRFAEEGAKVCVADINLAGAEETVGLIREQGGEAFACQADISQEADNDRMVTETVARYGGLDIAHLNAAILGQIGDFLSSSTANFDRVIAVNQRGCYLGLKSAGRAIRREGAIIVMSSTAGLMGWPDNAAYSASKHAIIGLARSAAHGLALRGVRVNVVCPGTINTTMTLPNPAEETLIPAADLKMPPFKGLATTQHVAELVLYLASSRASFITGAVHTVDGGLTCGFPSMAEMAGG